MELSVVCPFYNEAEGIQSAVRRMVFQLMRLETDWELILVNDGSTDASFALAAHVAQFFPRVRVLGYPDNRGRGHALRSGIEAARGEIVVTTELDLSWGENIVGQMLRFLRENSVFDIVVASPHLPGGGYENVPLGRIWLSRLGNFFIRACVPGAVTMNTGMTRAYRRRAIRALPLRENGKEFHVEVIAKAHAVGLAILEIPSVLAWPDRDRAKRKTKLGLLEMCLGHVACVMKANPAQFTCMLGVAGLLLALAALALEQYTGREMVPFLGSFGVSAVLFYVALALLSFSTPLVWIGARIRSGWRRASDAQIARETAQLQESSAGRFDSRA
jgi:glycosyltransferase involved in cell wall biosynthesis